MPPQRANLVLASDIPHCERDVLVLDGLDVETCILPVSAAIAIITCSLLHTNCGNSGDDFTELQLVEDCGLSGRVQTDHENAHLLLAPEAVKQLRESETHIGGL